jgi:tRNA:m4X modification enzyme
LEDAANTTVAELGAGKAYLTLMIARATEACNFVVNDNQTFKLKADRILRRFVRDNVKHTAFVRCQADLKSFVVKGALQELQTTAASTPSCPPHLLQTPWKVVGVGKHLCGGATDYALRSLVAFGAEHGMLLLFFVSILLDSCMVGELIKVCWFAGFGSVAGAKGLGGLCIAPCCHHKCTWEAYVGKDELMELGLSQREIELAFWMAGMCLLPVLSLQATASACL